MKNTICEYKAKLDEENEKKNSKKWKQTLTFISSNHLMILFVILFQLEENLSVAEHFNMQMKKKMKCFLRIAQINHKKSCSQILFVIIFKARTKLSK